MTIDINPLRSRLESERKRLIERLEQLIRSVQITGGRRENPFGKWDEAARESLEVRQELVSEKQLRGNLAEVERALDKLGKGTYGLCDNCGQPIAPDRLEALPWARLCLSCKAEEEKKVKSRSFPYGRKVASYSDEIFTNSWDFDVPETIADWVEDMEDMEEDEPLVKRLKITKKPRPESSEENWLRERGKLRRKGSPHQA
jgi:DnaK suppressor protein